MLSFLYYSSFAGSVYCRIEMTFEYAASPYLKIKFYGTMKFRYSGIRVMSSGQLYSSFLPSTQMLAFCVS